MKKQLIILATMSFFIAALSGCGGETNYAEEELPRLSEVGLPTPPPTPARATASPFPKTTLAATEIAVRSDKALTTPTAESAGANSNATGELSYNGDMDKLADKVTELSGGYRPVAAALISAKEGVIVREGPGEEYPEVGQAPSREVLGVLGKNADGDWLYVLTVMLLQGWVPADALRVTGTLAKAPILPADPLAEGLASTEAVATAPTGAPAPATTAEAKLRPTASAAPTSAPKANDASGTIEPLDVNSLQTAASAQVRGYGLNMRQGPAMEYDVLDVLLGGDAVDLLALSGSGEWALVKAGDKGYAWVALDHLDVEGSLADVPVLLVASLGHFDRPGQIAPIFSPADVGAVQGSAGEGQGDASLPLASPPPQPISNGGSKIVFQSSSGGDIMLINPDGSGLHRLTHGIDPALSPDGQTIAFTRWEGEDGSLWLIDVDGSNERAILGGTKQAKHPAWSPDGQRVVINFQHGGRLEDKRKCASLLENNPDDIGRGLPWNVDPDSVEVEYRGMIPFMCWTLPPDPHWSARVVNLSDGSYQDLVAGNYAFGAEWDPANDWRIINSGLTGLTQLDLKRNEQWPLTGKGQDHTPAFSPNGQYIAVAYNNNGAYDIHRLDAGGNGRVQLTKTPLWVTTPGIGEGKAWNNVAPAWSPDGSQIAFLTDRGGRWEIWVMNADGGDPHPLFPDAVNDQLQINYDFVDERVLTWK